MNGLLALLARNARRRPFQANRKLLQDAATQLTVSRSLRGESLYAAVKPLTYEDGVILWIFSTVNGQ